MTTGYRSAIVLACFLLGLGTGGAGHPYAEEDDGGVEISVEGATVRYVPKSLSPKKRTPEGELDTIDKAGATLKVKRPISYRRATLPAGEYRLRVESSGGKRELVVGPLKDEDTPESKERSKKESERPEGKEEKGQGSVQDGEERPSELRAPLTVSAVKNPENRMVFGLKLLSNESRLQVQIRAGSTEASATFQLEQ
jgi:hypothetical protein